MGILEKSSGICFYGYIVYIKRKITRSVFTSHKVFNQIFCGSAIETVHAHYGPFLIFLSPLRQGF